MEVAGADGAERGLEESAFFFMPSRVEGRQAHGVKTAAIELILWLATGGIIKHNRAIRHGKFPSVNRMSCEPKERATIYSSGIS